MYIMKEIEEEKIMASYIYMTKEGEFVKLVESLESNWSASYKVEITFTPDINKATVLGFDGERFMPSFQGHKGSKSLREAKDWCDKNCTKLAASLKIERKVILKVVE